MVISNAALADILDSIGLPAIIFQAKQTKHINDAALSLMGYGELDRQHHNLMSVIHSASRRTALKLFRSLEDDSNPDAVVLRICPSDKRPCWVSVLVKPAPYAGDKHFLAIIRDVTREIITPQINYPSMVESLPIGIYRTLHDGTIVYANHTLAQLLGCSSVEELKQRNISEFYLDQIDREAAIARWNPDQTTYAREILWQRLDGTLIWVHTVGQILRDKKGNILYLQGSIEDYSEKNQYKTNLELRNHELEILQQIVVSLGTSLNVETTLQTVLEQMQQIVPFSSASIFLFQNRQMELLAEIGIPSKAKMPIAATTDTFFVNTHMGEYADTDVLVIPDVKQHPDWQPVEAMDHIRSWMGVALRYQNEVIGILNLDHTEVNFYNENHIRYAKTVAAQAAIAIINARLYEQAREEIDRRHEAQNILVHNLISTETLYWVLRNLFETNDLREVLPHVLNMLSAALEKTSLMLVVFEPETGQLRHMLQTNNGHLNIWQVFQNITGKPKLPKATMLTNDFIWVEGHHHTLTEGRKTFSATVWRRGLLTAIRHDEKAHDFAEADIELLVTVANQLTIALENEDKTNQLHNKSEHLKRLVDRRTRQLTLEQKRHQAILDATAEGIFYMENFHIQYANPAFCRMVDYSLEELYGKPLSFVRNTPDIPEKPNFNNLLDNKVDIEPSRSETKLRHRDGTEFHASLRFSIIGHPGDDILRMVAIARDISQERELYFQRARFIANAAHELRTPLSSLMLRMHMMKRQPEKVVQHLDNLDNAVNLLKHLVEELLDLSRFERGTIVLDRDNFVLQDLIQQAADTYLPFAEEQDVTIDLVHPDDPLAIHVDGNRIIQVVGNLIVNGINYNEAGGHVTVKTQIEVDHVGNRSVIIEVIDDGVGIAPELLPSQIFEPFSRPSEGSRRETGMGLALCREVANLHGGTIHARSTQGAGSVFRMMLPLD
ncbi:MAG: PAS domain S-box protein [Anaerolineae bacterium]|nr:PAS domain S-box protein [Anaerolineae bacterium]MDQ7036133.1 PAS domain S-box protein [Anaerolineae bacterium]